MALVAGCGSSSNSDQATAPVAPAQATTATTAASTASKPLTKACARRARAVVERAAGQARAHPFTSPSLAVSCRLLTTDGVRLIDVKVRWPSASTIVRRALAIRLARVYLGPLQKPPGF